MALPAPKRTLRNALVVREAPVVMGAPAPFLEGYQFIAILVNPLHLAGSAAACAEQMIDEQPACDV
jgi:hypothetical protein